MSALETIQERIGESLAVKQALLDTQAGAIAEAGELLVACIRGGHKAILFGNGGSAADALHIATELVGRYLRQRPALAAIALTANPCLMTAVGNDYGYEQLFSRQVEGLCRPGDLAIGISTSGRSKNVIAGLEAARRLGAKTVGLTGEDPRDMGSLCDVAICVPSASVPRIQECHLVVGHILCELVETAIHPDAPSAH